MPTRPERGVTLPTILFFLLVITIAASYGIRRLMLDESGARNPLDQEVAREAAEAGLRDAERDLRLAYEAGKKPDGAACSRDRERPLPDGLVPPLFNASCTRGQCRFELDASLDGADINDPKARPQPWWPSHKNGKWNDGAKTGCSFDGGVPLGTFTGTPRLTEVARQPEYLIEYMRRGTSDYFRISARGFGSDLHTEVVLQTFYRLPE
jgi:type IV pilus assembly protein PilX